jgi:hypothetical protein
MKGITIVQGIPSTRKERIGDLMIEDFIGKHDSKAEKHHV